MPGGYLDMAYPSVSHRLELVEEELKVAWLVSMLELKLDFRELWAPHRG